MAEDILEPCLADDEEVVASPADAVGAKLELCRAFLTAHIQDPAVADGEKILKYERRFSYAGLASDEDDRAFYEPSAEDAVEFFARHVEPWLVDRFNLIDRSWS